MTPMASSAPHQRIYLHIGLQKTGTSYLQSLLFASVETLAAQGLDVVPSTNQEAFWAMLDVRGRLNPERDSAQAVGALDRFAEDLRRAGAPAAIFSQESLCSAKPDQIRRLLAACGDREVHVIATVRDVGRQIPSMWQELIKAGKSESYAHYLTRLKRRADGKRTGWEWLQIDAPTTLARWAKAGVPAERIHVVTVPHQTGDALLTRFCSVLDVDPGRMSTADQASNSSLGRAQVEVLRRVNAALPDELRRRQVYGDVGKRFFARRILGVQDGARTRLPTDMRAWCDELATRQIRKLRRAGYHVVGDLAELMSLETAYDDGSVRIKEREVAEAAVTALTAMLTRRLSDAATAKEETDPAPSAGGLLSRLRR